MIAIDPGCEPRELVRASGRPGAIGMIALPASRERVPQRGQSAVLLFAAGTTADAQRGRSGARHAMYGVPRDSYRPWGRLERTE